MWEAIHAASDFYVDVSISGQLGDKVVLLHEVVGEVCEFEMHVLKAGHWGVLVEIFYVDGHKSCAWGGNDTFEEEFDREEVNIRSSAVNRVVYSIAADGESCVVRIIIFWLVDNNDVAVGDIFPAFCGDIGVIKEENFVGAFNLARYSLEKSS